MTEILEMALSRLSWPQDANHIVNIRSTLETIKSRLFTSLVELKVCTCVCHIVCHVFAMVCACPAPVSVSGEGVGGISSVHFHLMQPPVLQGIADSCSTQIPLVT